MSERPLTLSQVVGRLRVAREANNRAGTALRNGLKEGHVTGMNRSFLPDDEEKRLLQKNANEIKAVPVKVDQSLTEDAAISAEALDWMLTQDTANCAAKADLIVDGATLLENVPVSSLLALEKYFSEYKKVILENLPILDPARNWTWDAEQGVWKSDKEQTGAFVRTKVPLVLHQGTDKHPPQAIPDDREIHIGVWDTVIPSGAIPETRKRLLLRRADRLIAGCKEAVAVANHTPAQKITGGKALFDFILSTD